MPKNYKIISLDFQEKTVSNPLQTWRDALQADLEAKNYTMFVSETYFLDAPHQSMIPLIYILNNRLAVLEPTQRDVLEYALFDYLSPTDRGSIVVRN